MGTAEGSPVAVGSPAASEVASGSSVVRSPSTETGGTLPAEVGGTSLSAWRPGPTSRIWLAACLAMSNFLSMVCSKGSGSRASICERARVTGSSEMGAAAVEEIRVTAAKVAIVNRMMGFGRKQPQISRANQILERYSR